MKRRIHNLVLAIIFCITLIPILELPVEAAQYNYDVNAALDYAREYWNDGKGLCAEFVSRCVIDGGLNISVQDGTGPCYRAIGKATGLGPSELSENNDNLPSLSTLILDSKGNATKTANGSILSAGDVVIQWCFTHHKSPHILICGGYNSSGNATFYAHNGALNNGTYNLARNTGKDANGNRLHPDSCNMGAKVIHLSGESGGTVPPPTSTVTAPSAPTGLTAVKASEKTAKISWNAISGATYEVEYYSPKANAWIKDSDYHSGTSYISTGLSLYNSYRFHVRAINSAGRSAWTEVTYYKTSQTCTNHTYNSSGYCSVCGVEYPINFTAKNEIFYAGKDDVPIRKRPYAPDTIIFSIPKGTQVDVIGSGKNSAGNLWYQVDDGTWIYSENLTKTKPANTTVETVTVQYNANGGSGAPATHTVQLNNEGIGNWNIPTTKPTRRGYDFLGWSSDSNATAPSVTPGERYGYAFSVMGMDTMTLYAVWKAAPTPTYGTVTIQYSANGGSGTPNSHTVTKDQYGDVNFNLSSTKPTRSGYTFLGWRLFNDSAYAIDSPGQSIAFSTGNVTSNDTLTYYAQWSVNSDSANISYTLDGYDCTKLEKNMTVNVGAGSTLRFAQAVSATDNDYTAIPNGKVVYVYGVTINTYPNKSGTYINWAKISYNGQTGWVNYAWLK